MNVCGCCLCECTEKVLEQFGLEIAHITSGWFPLNYAVRAARKIERRCREAVVHRHQEVAGTQNPALVSERSFHSFTERDSHVLDCVMLIHVQIAARLQIQIHRAVPGDLLEHMIEEAHPGGNARVSAAIEVQLYANVRLFRFPVQRRFSHRIASSSRTNRRVWSSVPMVIRT